MNPYIIIGLIVLWLGSLAAVGKWQNTAGRESERVAWQEREGKSLAAANAKIVSLTTAVRAKEQESASTIASMGAEHAKAIETLEGRRRRDVAAVRDGTIRLRVAGACPTNPGGGGAPEVAAAPRIGDGPATVELPREVTADLLTLANDADQVADQLRSCQSVLEAYFRAVNGAPIPVLRSFKLEKTL